MKTKKHTKIIILGSGPAGYTAAIYAARANLDPILITGDNQGGQLMNTDSIENWPGDKNKITGVDLMNRMYEHAVKYKTKIICDKIISVQFNKKPFYLSGENHQYIADSVIIATGSSPRYLGLNSEEKFKGKGVSTCAICDGFLYKDQEIAVVGGGNTAIEETLYLSNFALKIHLIHRRDYFKAEKILVNRLFKLIKNKKVILYFNHTIKEICGDKLSVTHLILNDTIKKSEKKILVSGLFIAIGHIPNIDIFINQLETDNGYIKIKKEQHGNYTQTSIPGIFAAGDVTDHIYRQAITSSASGCMAAIDSERYLHS